MRETVQADDLRPGMSVYVDSPGEFWGDGELLIPVGSVDQANGFVQVEPAEGRLRPVFPQGAAVDVEVAR